MADALHYPASQSSFTTPLAATPYSQPEFYRPPLVYPDVPFHEMLARSALRVPERPAIYWRDVTLTYRELYALARSAAAGLRALGLRKGDRLCLLMTNRPEYAIAWMAGSMLGIVLSPMNPSYKEREVGYQLEISGAGHRGAARAAAARAGGTRAGA
jgi:long-chain acyl-CoA synthetase